MYRCKEHNVKTNSPEKHKSCRLFIVSENYAPTTPKVYLPFRCITCNVSGNDPSQHSRTVEFGLCKILLVEKQVRFDGDI